MPSSSDKRVGVLDQETLDLYRKAMRALEAAGIPFLVGGAYAFARYTGIVRHTKDFDIFLRPDVVRRALDALEQVGFRTEVWSEVWLAKAFDHDVFVDLIFSSGNGLARVDHEWFHYGVPEIVLGEQVLLVPMEEMIWSKAFVQERERYDGADVLHILRGCAQKIDWQRLIARFGDQWRVLYAFLIQFGFAYPSDRDAIPLAVMTELGERLAREQVAEPPAERVCMGTLLSNKQFLPDTECWDYADGRIVEGSMTPLEVQQLTAELHRQLVLPDCE